MEYNTQQRRLPLPEYGRSVQNMVDHALTIEDRAERQRCANTIINIMGGMFPHLRDVPDFKHKLWDHLAIMADFKLDIDYPYEIVKKESLEVKPEVLAYPQKRIRYRHYGHILENMVKKAVEYPEGEDRKHLISLIANQMKNALSTGIKTVWKTRRYWMTFATIPRGLSVCLPKICNCADSARMFSADRSKTTGSAECNRIIIREENINS